MNKLAPSSSLLPLLGAALLSLPAGLRADAKLPPFLKPDSLYIFDGSEDDIVKVLELSDSSWVRVQTKAGESWVNIDNVTSITPISKEVASKTEMRQKADYILAGAQEIDQAINEYAAKNNLAATASFKWDDVRKFLKPESITRDSKGKDVIGRPYLFGAKVSDGVKVNPDTVKDVSAVIEDPDTYWGKFKP